MVTNEKVLQAVVNAIEAVNQLLPTEARLGKTVDTILMGDAGAVDSLKLVNLIVAIEQEIEQTFHVSINLADDESMSLAENPFATVGSLANYVSLLLERKSS
ncbi:MAG: hypothetical protein FJY85_21305 [Deltaproteobacteria bacterium]|nr:hypothetical protein [Deltaproteobacteria bacterium]